MSNRRTFRQWRGAAADEREHKASCPGEESVYSDSDESVYAASSSSNGGTSGTERSSLSSSDGYLHSVDDGCGQDGGHYDEVGGYWEWRLAAERRCCLSARPTARAVAPSGEFIQTRSRWTTSSLLCGVSALLATCSLSSLAACIALTSISLSCIELSRVAATASAPEDGVEVEDIPDRPQIDVWTERLLNPPLEDRLQPPSQQHASMQRELAQRYSWDCIAQAGHTKCSPVQKAQSRKDGVQSSVPRQSAAEFRVTADGVYHISAQIAGTVWQRPPTLLRAVIARIRLKSVSVNVTTAHAIAGAPGGGPSATALRGIFSIYTAAAVLLSAGDELQARIICVEEPECVVHVNGTSSYLTLERLD